MNTERAIWIFTLIFFSPFFFIFLVISALLFYADGAGFSLFSLLKDLTITTASVVAGYILSVKWNKKQIEAARKQQIKESFLNLSRSIKLNIDLLDISKPFIDSNGSASFRLDSASFILAIHDIAGIVDEDFVRDINWQRVQVDHVSVKLAVLEDAFLNIITCGEASKPLHTALYLELNKKLREQVSQTREDLGKLIERIETEEKKSA